MIEDLHYIHHDVDDLIYQMKLYTLEYLLINLLQLHCDQLEDKDNHWIQKDVEDLHECGLADHLR